ncbi:Ulp1 protease family, C-terminal catalytic domain containing protein [Trema orientale]|uniref:Ulp1 protease family, C-terminal catalytic domain containing protein n=1 Tax=Trema orientale TaxID=63057 RepID=A0A2P5AI66_TREOI|nr:Ulp1 protease family, C-terminal catalytic domain containing protein [Trema orientale]
MQEFAISTGLNCGEYPSFDRRRDMEEGILSKFFDKKKKVSRKEFKLVFKNHNGSNDEDTVKLAKLYCLESFVLVKQETLKMNNDYIRMKGLNNPGTEGHGLSGFPHALIVWAYECMPELAKSMGANKIGAGIPRLLNWEGSDNQYEWTDLKVNEMTPTHEEMEQEFMAPFLRKRKLPEKGQENIEKEEKNDKNMKGCIGCEKESILKKELQALKRKCEETEKNQIEMKEKMSIMVTMLQKIYHALVVDRKKEEIKVVESDNQDSNRKNDTEVNKDGGQDEGQRSETNFNITDTVDYVMEYANEDNHCKDGLVAQTNKVKEGAENKLDTEMNEKTKETKHVAKKKQVEELNEKIKEREEVVNKGKEKVVLEYKRHNLRERDALKPGVVRKSPFTTKFGSADDENQRKRKKVIDPTMPSFDLHLTPSPMAISDSPNPPIAAFNPSPLAICPPLVPENNELVQPFVQYMPFYHDIDKEPDNDWTIRFEEWIKDNLNERNKENPYGEHDSIKEPFDFGVVNVEFKSFFYFLWKEERWLVGQHMDLAFYYLRKKLWFNKKYTQRCTTGDALVDSWFQMACGKYLAEMEDLNWNEKPMHHLVRMVYGGVVDFGRPWKDVDYVYIPSIVKEIQHWILLQISFQQRTIFVYDSMGGAAHKKKILKVVAPYAMFIPQLLSQTNFFDERKDVKPGYNDFDIHIVKDIEIQQNGGDCGPFVIKRAEALMTDQHLSIVTQKKMKLYRRNMAVEFYTWGQLKFNKVFDSGSQ